MKNYTRKILLLGFISLIPFLYTPQTHSSEWLEKIVKKYKTPLIIAGVTSISAIGLYYLYTTYNRPTPNTPPHDDQNDHAKNAFMAPPDSQCQTNNYNAVVQPTPVPINAKSPSTLTKSITPLITAPQQQNPAQSVNSNTQPVANKLDNTTPVCNACENGDIETVIVAQQTSAPTPHINKTNSKLTPAQPSNISKPATPVVAAQPQQQEATILSNNSQSVSSKEKSTLPVADKSDNAALVSNVCENSDIETVKKILSSVNINGQDSSACQPESTDIVKDPSSQQNNLQTVMVPQPTSAPTPQLTSSQKRTPAQPSSVSIRQSTPVVATPPQQQEAAISSNNSQSVSSKEKSTLPVADKSDNAVLVSNAYENGNSANAKQPHNNMVIPPASVAINDNSTNSKLTPAQPSNISIKPDTPVVAAPPQQQEATILSNNSQSVSSKEKSTLPVADKSDNAALVSDACENGNDDLAVIKNVAVYKQFPFGNECGHHALKNALYYLSYLDGNSDALKKTLDKATYDDFFEMLCDMLYGSRNDDYSYETHTKRIKPLDNGKLIRILQEQKNKLPKEFTTINNYFSPEYITVLSDYPQWYLMGKDDVLKFLQVIELLQQSQNYKHAFLLGVGPRPCSQLNTHWIAVVAYKQNGYNSYRLFDSLGYNRVSDVNVNSLITLLSQSKSDICNVITRNFSDFYKKHFDDFVRIFQTTGKGAKGIQDELNRFIELYELLHGEDSLLPEWMTKIQNTYLQLCDNFLHYDSKNFQKLSRAVKEAAQNDQSNIEHLKQYLMPNNFKKHFKKN